MKLSELEILIPTGAVSGIVVYRPSDSESWIIDVEFDDPPPALNHRCLNPPEMKSAPSRQLIVR